MAEEITSGYLNTDFQDQYDEISDSFGEYFELAKELNSFAHKILYELDKGLVHNLSVRELVVTTLFLRILESYQGVIIYAKKGLVAPSKMILRCMLDQVSSIVLNSNDESFLKTYIFSHEHDRLYAHKKMKEYGIKTHYDIDKKIEEIKSSINEKNVQKVQSLKLLHDAGLADKYIGVYLLFSEAVHTTSKDLEFYLQFDNEKDTVHSIQYGPSKIDLEKVLMTAIAFLLDGLGSISTVFDLALSEKIESYGVQLHKIHLK